MIEKLELLDRELFLFLNGLHAEWLDPIMYLVSSKAFWIPVYLILFYLVYRKYGWRGVGFFTLGVALVILFCDQLSSSVFKPYFARYRPCNNLEIMDLVHKVNNSCGRGFSYLSGHATNYFGLAIFTARVLGGRKLLLGLMIWATLIAYSRIYLGVHYPADVASGAVLGLLIGTLLYQLLKRFFPQKTKA